MEDFLWFHIIFYVFLFSPSQFILNKSSKIFHLAQQQNRLKRHDDSEYMSEEFILDGKSY